MLTPQARLEVWLGQELTSDQAEFANKWKGDRPEVTRDELREVLDVYRAGFEAGYEQAKFDWEVIE